MGNSFLTQTDRGVLVDVLVRKDLIKEPSELLNSLRNGCRLSSLSLKCCESSEAPQSSGGSEVERSDSNHLPIEAYTPWPWDFTRAHLLVPTLAEGHKLAALMNTILSARAIVLCDKIDDPRPSSIMVKSSTNSMPTPSELYDAVVEVAVPRGLWACERGRRKESVRRIGAEDSGAEGRHADGQEEDDSDEVLDDGATEEGWLPGWEADGWGALMMFEDRAQAERVLAAFPDSILGFPIEWEENEWEEGDSALSTEDVKAEGTIKTVQAEDSAREEVILEEQDGVDEAGMLRLWFNPM